jgi:hypothetical protein
VNKSFVLKYVSLVLNLHFNLLYVSQLLENEYEVRFKNGSSRDLDARGDLVCQISPLIEFLVPFFNSSGPF